MGLNLSSFFNPGKPNTALGNSMQVSQTTSSEGASNNHVTQEIRNMAPGQTFQGEVVAIRNGEVDIALSKDLIITARLERDMNIELGQTMTFEIKAISDAKVSIRPLFENRNQNTTILNAIHAARIPLNNTSVSMVSTMMEEGMAVDKESLQNSYRQILNNPEVGKEMIVQMNRMQIPVTPENIMQFQNFKNYENNIMNATGDVADQLLQAFDTILQNGKQTDVDNFMELFVQIFAGKVKDPSATSWQETMEKGERKSVDAIVLEKNDTIDQMIKDIGEVGKISFQKSLESGHPIIAEGEQNGLREVIEDNGTEITSVSLLEMNKEERIELSAQMHKAGIPEDTVALVKSGQITAEKLLHIVKDLISKIDFNKNPEIAELLSSKGFMSLMKGQVIKQWMILPEEVAKEGKIEELYNRIQQQTVKLAESMANITKESSPLMKSVSQLSSNVEFMNQLNNLYTYVQLPLKMSQENAHGELYVYTNKKSLASKDGNVSALLHLEMDHLGTIDIYVAMQHHKVSTKFYLEKEEMITFLTDHIHLLKDRLEKSGYSMTSEVLLKEQEINIVDEMMNKNKNNAMISQFSFDVRA